MRSGSAAGDILAPSIRSGFVWTLAGNGVYAVSQWAILSLTAKLGGAEMLGQYALVVALATPVVMFAHLNLRAVLATDVARRHAFGDYLVVRIAASAVGMLAVAYQASLAGNARGLATNILLTGLIQSTEAVSDIFYGAMQRRGEMSSIARSMMARGGSSIIAFGLALYGLRDLSWALASLAVARVIVLLVYDVPQGTSGESLARHGRRDQAAILRSAVPLGLVLLLISLNTNLPRYAIEHYLGLKELGVFAGLAAFITAGNTVANALGQSATPHLAQQAGGGHPRAFLRLTMGLAASLFALGLAGALLAWVLGPSILSLVYRKEFAEYGGLLVAVMGAAALGYVGVALGYAITAARSFDAQAALFCLVAGTCGVTSWLLVPHWGLSGAVMALAAAALVQIAGEVALLRRAMARMVAPR